MNSLILELPHTKSEPEENCASFLRATPAGQSLNEVIAFVFSVRVVLGLFTSRLCPSGNGGDETEDQSGVHVSMQNSNTFDALLTR